jgi:hypothetical protein
MVLVCTLSGEIVNVNIYGGPFPVQCKACNESLCVGCSDIINQKRIWKQVRAPASQYTLGIEAQNIVGGLSNTNAGNYSGIFNGTLNRINN